MRSSNQCSQFLPVAVDRQPWTWVDGAGAEGSELG